MINLTKELLEEEKATSGGGRKDGQSTVGNWKEGDKVMAIWRVDGKYYSATINQVLEDGTCTVIFDGYSSVELTQVTKNNRA